MALPPATLLHITPGIGYLNFEDMFNPVLNPLLYQKALSALDELDPSTEVDASHKSLVAGRLSFGLDGQVFAVPRSDAHLFRGRNRIYHWRAATLSGTFTLLLDTGGVTVR